MHSAGMVKRKICANKGTITTRYNNHLSFEAILMLKIIKPITNTIKNKKDNP
jgi:hypothetical protein